MNKRAEESAEKRREHRIQYSSISLPFLGIRLSDHVQFQFLLVDSSSSGLQITVPDWVIEWDKFVIGEELNLCLPFSNADKILDTCKVRWQKTDAKNNEQFIGLEQAAEKQKTALFKIDEFGMLEPLDAKSDQQQLFLRMLKDSFMLKRGVLIYLEHFLPYFSRIASDYDHYDETRSFLLEDAIKNVKERIESLEQLHAKFKDGFADGNLSVLDLDMNLLRAMFESEISNELFKMTFPEQLLLNYIEEIKNLEMRLFSNYNSLVTTYSLTLEASLL